LVVCSRRLGCVAIDLKHCRMSGLKVKTNRVALKSMKISG